jgi:hypothetical protein
MTVLNIKDNDISNGDIIIEYNPRYEHELAAGVQRVVALVYQQKAKIDISTMTKFDKVLIFIAVILTFWDPFKAKNLPSANFLLTTAV